MEKVYVVLLRDDEGERRFRGVALSQQAAEQIIADDIEEYSCELEEDEAPPYERSQYEVLDSHVEGGRTIAEHVLAELVEWEARMGGFEAEAWASAKKYMKLLRKEEDRR
jgi:hypothetical protein